MRALDPRIVVLSYSGGEGAGDDAARDCSRAILGCGCGADGGRDHGRAARVRDRYQRMDGAPGKRARRSPRALVYAADTDEEGSRGGVRTRTRTRRHNRPRRRTSRQRQRVAPRRDRALGHYFGSSSLRRDHATQQAADADAEAAETEPAAFEETVFSPQKWMRSKRPPYPHVKEHTTPAHLRHRRRGGRVWRAARERRGRSQGGTC
jgi:hypothetical protein